MLYQAWIKSNNRMLACVHNMAKNNTKVAALLVSGFSQSMCDIDYFMSRLARQLVLQNITVIQVDPYGCGDSQGMLENMTISTIYEDLIESTNYIEKLGYETIIFIGRGIAATLFERIIYERKGDKFGISINPFYSSILKEDLYRFFSKDEYKSIEFTELLRYKTYTDDLSFIFEAMGTKISNLKGQKINICTILNEINNIKNYSQLIKNLITITYDEDSSKGFSISEGISEENVKCYKFKREAIWQNQIISLISDYVKGKILCKYQ